MRFFLFRGILLVKISFQPRAISNINFNHKQTNFLPFPKLAFALILFPFDL